MRPYPFAPRGALLATFIYTFGKLYLVGLSDEDMRHLNFLMPPKPF
jgi:hypothetical protein